MYYFFLPGHLTNQYTYFRGREGRRELGREGGGGREGGREGRSSREIGKEGGREGDRGEGGAGGREEEGKSAHIRGFYCTRVSTWDLENVSAVYHLEPRQITDNFNKTS